ncbi:MAG TPA: hypothetical protein VHR66_25250, partial [Gemmataceae bacterium]|nr:hypothetical protein [Gemmataceae bacterium]
ALTGGFLLLARKPGQPVLPSVICAGLALVAVAPRLVLQPTIATFLFLSVLLFLLIRVPRRPGSWLFPALVAGLFWIWANFDQWFFLGPVLLLLYAAGQYVRKDENEDMAALWKALALGVLACMLNPHHVRVWMLPAEMVDSQLASVFANDQEFAPLFRQGTQDLFATFDNPKNTYSVWILIGLTILGFGFNRHKASVGLALVWVLAFALALLHSRAIPFLAIISAPVAAVNLAAAVQRLANTPMSDGTLRAMHALRAGGRVVCGLGAAFLIALSYPGWLNTTVQDRRWKWDVEPDPSLERAAKKIHDWRTAGILPPDARMLNLQPVFANYVYWFAPGEKAYFDFRVGFHRPEASYYADLRRYVSHQDFAEKRKDPFEMRKFLRENQIAFAVSAHPERKVNQATIVNLWIEGAGGGGIPDWAIWEVQGRAVIVGWEQQRAIPAATFDQLRFNPLRNAYVGVEMLPSPPQPLHPPNPPMDEWERYLISPPVAPVDAEEAFVLALYRESLWNQARIRHTDLLQQILGFANTRLMTPAFSVWAFHQAQVAPVMIPREVTAAALLTVRSARRAILASPDHPDGYFALARAYADPNFSATADVRDVVASISLARARARIANDPSDRRATFSEAELFQALFSMHMSASPSRQDLALETLRLASAYARRDLEIETAKPAPSTEARDRQDRIVDGMRKRLEAMEKTANEKEAARQKGQERFVIVAASMASALDRSAAARRFGLYREAISELRKAQEEYQKKVKDGEDSKLSLTDQATNLAIHAELIELLWNDGKFEEAVQILDSVDSAANLQAMEGMQMREAYYRARMRAAQVMFQDAPQQRQPSPFDSDPAAHFRALRRAASLAAGQFERAAEDDAREAQTMRTIIADFRRDNFPVENPKPIPPIPPIDRFFDAVYRPLLSPLSAVSAQLGGMARTIHIQKVDELDRLNRSAADQQVRIGLAYLEQGDIKSARHYFVQSQNAPDLQKPSPSQRIAREYLRGIDAVSGNKGTAP